MNAFDDLEAQIAALECVEYHSHNEDEDDGEFSENDNDLLEEFFSRPTPVPPAMAANSLKMNS